MPQRLRLTLLVVLLASVGRDGAAQTSLGAALYAQAGWEALAAGQPRAAAEAFEQALATEPKTATLHLGAGLAAFAEHRDDAARTFAERALQLDATLWRARELLGRVQSRQGDLDGAIRTFEQLVAAEPSRATLTDTLGRWRQEAELRDRMHLAVGSRFTVAFAGAADAGLATAALAALDRASARIGDVLGVYPVTPIHVVLYTTEQFRDITRAPDWAGGAFDGIIRVPVRQALERRAEFDRVLAHEYTHALVHSLAPGGLPAWLNKGLAAALEKADRRPPPPLRAWPLAALRQSFHRMTGQEAREAYDFSAFAVGRLLDEAGGFALMTLLRDLGDGVDFETAFAHRLQRSMNDFEASLRQP